MKLIKISLFKIECTDNFKSNITMLLEADSFAEAEKLFIENYPEYKLKSITKYCVDVFRKSTKTINIEV
jgi:hypothetical protein